jgi:hypothetical protein
MLVQQIIEPEIKKQNKEPTEKLQPDKPTEKLQLKHKVVFDLSKPMFPEHLILEML